ncbi:MAG: hypothetical protein ACREJ0_22915 [Geminicoccaceae bacterium]
MLLGERSTDASTAFADAIAERVAADQGLTTSLADLEEPPWVASIRHQVAELQQLKSGWDGFDAVAIRRDVLEYACSLLETVMMDDTAPPHITPMSSEGVLIEWHLGRINLEIEVETPREAWVFYENHDEGSEESWPVKNDFRSLASPIEEVTRRSSTRTAS